MNIIKPLLAFLLLSSATTAYSLSIYVTRSGDSFDGKCDSHCSLREAVQLANETPGHDHIYLEHRFPLTYILSRTPPYVNGERVDDDRNKVGDLDILDDVTIEGAAFADVTAVKAEHASRVFENHSGSSRFFNLTINGGGVTNHATLEMRNTHVHNAFHYVRGGAIANYGTLAVSSAIISGGVASARVAGQIAEGGGIYNEGVLTVRDSELRNNTARGVRNSLNGGGGLFNRGQADIRRTLFTDNSLGGDQGNGLAILNADGGSMKLVSSTVSGNKGAFRPLGFGAAVANGDSLYIPQGEMQLTNVTIVHNEARGFFNAGKTYIKNSIIAKNSPRSTNISNCYNYGGNLTTYGLLLGMDQTGNCASDLPIVDDTLLQITTLLQIRPSSIRYSGPTHGHTLLTDNPAIDAGGFDCPAFDQITLSAPIDGNGDSIAECDLGALEYRPDNELTQ